MHTLPLTTLFAAEKGGSEKVELRVPLFIDFPGNTLKGDSCVVPVTGADLYPTFLDMAGIPLMPGQHQDGVSLLPLLQGKSIPERALYWHYPHYGNRVANLLPSYGKATGS